MIDFGSTISLEAWSLKAKPNLDLNHAWGAVPLNIIARYVLGITPLEPGFKKISIRPQLGGLKYVKGSVPTVAGKVTVEVTPEKLIFTTPSFTEVTVDNQTLSFKAGTHEIIRFK
jgi:hypothetical protein